MFSTALGQSRLEWLPNIVRRYLERVITEQGAGPDNFSLQTFINPNDTDINYSIRCHKCNNQVTRILCDWSKDYDLDGLMKSVLEFTNDHRHGPTPVPSVEPVAAVVEYPNGYRKFREV